MGMSHDHHPGHEGFLVGFLRLDGRWHQVDGSTADRTKVTAVSVECSCGWRSPRVYAPLGAFWSHNHVFAGPRPRDDEHFRDTAVWPLFRGHLHEIRRMAHELEQRECFSAHELAAIFGKERLP